MGSSDRSVSGPPALLNADERGSSECGVCDPVLGGGGDGDFSEGLSPVPAIPEDQPLSVGGDGGDEGGGCRQVTQAAVDGRVLGHQRVVKADALDGAVVARQQQTYLPEPRQCGGGSDTAGASLAAGALQCPPVPDAHSPVP